MSLKVAIVHYHLRPGGVTRVMENTVGGLAAHGVEILALAGEAPDTAPAFEFRLVDGLGYVRDQNAADCDAATLAARLRVAAREGFGGRDPDVWHVHNHCLGKNVLLPLALRILAGQGRPMLLHIHDFAEDGRPANYQVLRTSANPPDFGPTVYPNAPQVHYAALNRRDLKCLAAAGVPSDRLHWLPNPVSLPEGSAPDPGSRDRLPEAGEDLTLYPGRGIRRKNLGELVLWAAHAEPGQRLAMTLRPANPAERVFHDRWEAFVESRKLPLLLAAGERAPFERWLQSADRFITTSLAEGFGLAFLEPWLFGKPLVGRDLPEITQDFAEAGLVLDDLYSFLGVPLTVLDGPDLHDRVAASMQAAFSAYGRPLPKDYPERAVQAHVRDGAIDFGFLDETLQEGVLDKAMESPDLRHEIFSSVPRLGAPAGVVDANRAMVGKSYSLEQYGDRLRTVYQAVASCSNSRLDGLDGDILLDAFLAPERFTLLRA